jgi:hypothetical protein
MKKFLKLVGAIFGVMFVLGIIGNCMGETEKPKEETKVESKVDKESKAEKNKKAQDKLDKIIAEEEAEKKAKEEAAAKEKAEEQAAKEAINLGVTVEEFEFAWANLSDEVGVELLLKNGSFKEGEVFNTKTYDVNDNISVLTTIHRGNNVLREITVVAMPSQDDITNSEILMSYALAIGGTNTALTPDERGDIFFALTDQNPTLEEMSTSTTHKGFKYTLMVSKTLGMWLSIADEDMK